VNETLGDAYVGRGWRWPLLVAAVIAGGYITAVYQLAPPDRLDASELAADLKPLIIKKWRDSPELQRAVVHDVSLVHKGGTLYAGFVEVTLDGQAERLPLEVVYDRGDIWWKIQRPSRR
jgi:hypothetical protein